MANLTTTEQAVWQRPGVPASLWLPLFAHFGLSLLWWALYLQPRWPSSWPLLTLVALAGGVAYPAVGGGRLLGLAFVLNAPPQRRLFWGITGGGYAALQALFFFWFLPDVVLPHAG